MELPEPVRARIEETAGPFVAFIGPDALWIQPDAARGRDFGFHFRPRGRGWQAGFVANLPSGRAPGGTAAAAQRLGAALENADGESRTFLERIRAILADPATVQRAKDPVLAALARSRVASAPTAECEDREPAETEGVGSGNTTGTSAHDRSRPPFGEWSDADVLHALAAGEVFDTLLWAEIQGTDAPASPARAVVAGLLGDLDGARDEVQQIVDTTDGTEAAHRFAHRAFNAAGAFERADAAAFRAADAMTRDAAADLLSEVAFSRIERHDFPGARDAAIRAARLAPEDAETVARTAAVLEKSGDLDGALALYARASEFERRHPQARAGALRLTVWRGDFEDALPLAAAFQRDFPDSVDGWRAAGVSFVMLGRHDEAEHALRAALQCAPRDPESLLWRAELRLANGDPEGALSDIDTSTLRTQRPAEGVLHALAGLDQDLDLRQFLNDPGYLDNIHDGLFAHTLPLWMGAERVREACESDDGLRVLLRDTLTMMGGNRSDRPTRVVVAADGHRSLEALATPPRSREQSGDALRLLRSSPVAEAMERFNEIEARFPDSPHPLCYRGELRLWIGQYEEALLEFSNALAKVPVRWGYVGQAAAYSLLGNTDAAMERVHRVGEVFPPVPGATTHVYVGELYRKLGRLEDAERELLAGLGAKPERQSAWMNLALVYLAQGRKDEARELWERVVRAVPGLIWLAGRAAGVPPRERTDFRHMEPVFSSALTVMRGNRSSHLITYFVDDQLRVVPAVGVWPTVAGAGIDVAEEELLRALGRHGDESGGAAR